MGSYFETENGKLYCSDNVTYLNTVKDNTFDLTVTSPPYDNLREYHGYTFDFENIAKELFRITKIGGVVVWVVGDATINGSETGTSFRQALYFMECGFNLHDTMIYSKNGFAFPSSNRYHQTFEYMFVFSKETPKTFNPIKDKKNLNRVRGGMTKRNKDGTMGILKGAKYLKEWGIRFNIWCYEIGKFKVTKDEIAYSHPAIFPEQLAYDHIISWSNEGDIVLDPFIGSGTTAKMCEKSNRKWVGCEISEYYCKIAKQRIKAEADQIKLNFGG
ncbi:MAG: site-specific DNA-methyltransferase [Bacteroidetes bacterium]|nr:site-specific DNA-methyltransferase [Bacteroidota bacterium]